jgi:hypothetical protein
MIRSIALILLVGLTSLPVKGQISWAPVGPGAGSFLMSIAIHPENPDIVYVGGDIEGVYKTVDGGGSWRTMNTGIQGGTRTAAVYAVQELTIDPVDHETVYASTWSGLFKTIDGADSWSEISPRVATEDAVPYSFVTIDPANNQIIYTGIGDADADGDGTGEIFRSLDGGQTWTLLDTGIPEAVIHGIAIVTDTPAENRTLLASTGSGVFRSVDNGASWEMVNSGLPHTNARRLIYREDTTPGTLFLSIHSEGDPADHTSFKGGLYKSVDLGTSWTSINGDLPPAAYEDPDDPPPFYDYWKFAVHPADANTILTGTNLGGWSDQWGIHQTTDGGVTWEKADLQNTRGWLDTTWWNDDNISILEFAPSDPSVIYSGSEFIQKSTDGGASWTQAYTDRVGDAWRTRGLGLMEAYALAYDPTNQNVLYVGYDDMGIWRSDDGANAFLRLDETQKPGGYDSVSSIVIDPVTGTVYVSRDNGENDFTLDIPYSDGQVLKSNDQGASWTVIQNGLPEGRTILALDLNSSSDSRTIFAAVHRNGVYRSNDAGQTWVAKNEGLGANATYVWDLVIDPANTSTLYLGLNTVSGEETGGIYKSVDSGDSWTLLDGVPTWDVLDLAIDSDNSGTVYAGVTNSFAWSEEGGLYQTVDGGSTWTKPIDQPRIGAVAIKPGESSTVLAFSQPWWNQTSTQVAGVHLSTDGGASWEVANTDLGHIFVLKAVFNPHDPDQILVTTHGAGAWLGTFAQDTVEPPDTPSTDRPADFDGSGLVDFNDFLLFAGGFGKSDGQEGYVAQYDLDGSTAVDFNDFLLFVAAFGT